MHAIAHCARELSGSISRHGIRVAGKAEGGPGGVEPTLDVSARALFTEALEASGVRWFAAQEVEDAVAFEGGTDLAVSIAPLYGSINLESNVAFGTIFGFFPAEATAEESFLRPGRDLLAAGYILYGPQTSLVVSFGDAVLRYVLDRAEGTFRLVETGLHIPAQCFEYAINASNYRHWPRPIRAFIDDCVAGHLGPTEENFNMRWIASLVAETHRILQRGGVYLYPADDRAGYERGRLRLVFECAPIAFLVEHAGGKATDGSDRILDQIPASLHARTPFVFGSGAKVDRVAAYFDLPETETSALFGKRGLFRG